MSSDGSILRHISMKQRMTLKLKGKTHGPDIASLVVSSFAFYQQRYVYFCTVYTVVQGSPACISEVLFLGII